MEKVRCSIIQDLLPLYIDGAVSPQTAEAVKQHLNTCPSCQKEYSSMTGTLTLPVNHVLTGESARTLKAFKRRWKHKIMVIILISVVLTVLTIGVCAAVYQNVGAVHDSFSPSMHITLRDLNSSDGWQPIHFDNADVLNFDSVFYSRAVINDANSTDAVLLRFINPVSHEYVAEAEVFPGTSFSLTTLKRNTDYAVEIKSDAEFVHLNFH